MTDMRSSEKWSADLEQHAEDMKKFLETYKFTCDQTKFIEHIQFLNWLVNNQNQKFTVTADDCMEYAFLMWFWKKEMGLDPEYFTAGFGNAMTYQALVLNSPVSA